MQGQRWSGSPEDILDAVAAAGYQGIEFSNVMIGDFWDRPDDLQQALSNRGLELAGFAYARGGFTDPATYEDDLAGAEKALRLAARFSVPVMLAGPSSSSRNDYEEKFAQACRFSNVVAERGREQGVAVAVHPHSHHTSLVLTGAEYDRMLAATEASGLMFNPDTGHIVRSGQDLLDCFRRHRSRLVHVHCKDVDAQGRWQPMGKGICDFPRLFRWLRETGYRGWLISEEESDLVWQDLPGAMAQNRTYFRSLGY
jgi:sugar phosphate isomerase/epimerase